MINQIEEDKFTKENEKIKAKIESVEREINEDLALIPEYQLLQVYSKINKIITEDENKFTILKNKFIFVDKTLTGYINLKDFYDILNKNLSLEKDELKILLCDPVLRNKINPNLYQYKPFLTRISDFNENDIIQMRQEYNIYQNKYITELRNNIKIKNIDIKKLWENTFRDNAKCTKNNFYLLFNGLNSNYSYHYLELEYIFDLIRKKDEDFLSFESFNNILGKSRGEDLRVVFFKKVKEQREKEKKKEEEKLLINYYPNMMDNNPNNNINNDNEIGNEKTNYIILKEQQVINDDSPGKNEDKPEEQKTNLNSNPQFILGETNNNPNNLNQENNLNNTNNNHIKHDNQVVEGFEITESLISPYKNGNPSKTDTMKENINSNEQNKASEPPKDVGVKIKKYNQNIINVRSNLIKTNSAIIKDKLYFDELNKTSLNEIDNLMQKRFKNANEKVSNILSQHEEYIILKLYSSLNNQLASLDSETDALSNFKKKDAQNQNLLPFNDFISVLQNDMKLKFNQNDLKILLYSLEHIDIDNSLFPYMEFITNVKNSHKNRDKIIQIERLALINFNLYLVDFKKYIVYLIPKTNINIENIFNAVSSDKKNLTLDEFVSFCDCFRYKLSNIEEYQYIFDIISKDPSNKKVSKVDLYVFIHSENISEGKFIEDGKCHKNLGKNVNKNWYKFIPKYNLINNSLKENNMKYFEKFLLIINKQRIKFGIDELEDFFSNTCNVDVNGNVYKQDFIKAILILQITNQPIVSDLLFYLEDIYNNQKFQLANFIGIVNSYFSQEALSLKPPHNYHTYPHNPNILFKNNYGFFTSVDFKNIKTICSYIYETIYYIKRLTIHHYFTNFDYYKKGYFNLRQLRLIIVDDLGIEQNELVDLFLSYVLDNEKYNDLYIIKINKLIEVIAENVGIKIDEEEANLNKTFFYNDDVTNKLLNSTIMNNRLTKKKGSTYNYSPNAGIY